MNKTVFLLSFAALLNGATASASATGKDDGKNNGKKPFKKLSINTGAQSAAAAPTVTSPASAPAATTAPANNGATQAPATTIITDPVLLSLAALFASEGAEHMIVLGGPNGMEQFDMPAVAPTDEPAEFTYPLETQTPPHSRSTRDGNRKSFSVIEYATNEPTPTGFRSVACGSHKHFFKN